LNDSQHKQEELINHKESKKNLDIINESYEDEADQSVRISNIRLNKDQFNSNDNNMKMQIHLKEIIISISRMIHTTRISKLTSHNKIYQRVIWLP